MAAPDRTPESTPPAPRRRFRLASALALAALVPLSALAQDRRPGAASAPPPQDTAALHDEIERLRGRIDELGVELQRQDRLLGALAARPPEAAAPPAPARPAAAPVPKPSPPQSDAPALIVMVGNDGALTLEGRPASLPTLGYALRAASGNDPTRRVVVGAEPKASPAQVGEVVSALSQSGFGRITITGP